jgi:putative transposase
MVDQRYRKNTGAVFSLKYHLVWCPKYRLPVLIDTVKQRLLELLHHKAAELEATIRAVDIMPDHVHLFIESDPTQAPAHLANQFKGFSSRVLRQEFPHLKSRMPTLWSRSYFIGSVGAVSEATVKRYIEQQETKR